LYVNWVMSEHYNKYILLLAVATGCGRPGQVPSGAQAADSVRITQFYATASAAPRGESTNICYGVENAVAVEINPPVEKLSPSLVRCFAVSPTETTTYTLTAKDQQGKTAAQSVTLAVTGARPKFDDISISSKEVKPGQQIQFCFKATNAVAVRGSPGHFLSGAGSPKADCLIDHPRKTTSYKLTIVGEGGQTDEADITVSVR
jgi:hypothetical protein